jgi:hypothetical protein
MLYVLYKQNFFRVFFAGSPFLIEGYFRIYDIAVKNSWILVFYELSENKPKNPARLNNPGNPSRLLKILTWLIRA